MDDDSIVSAELSLLASNTRKEVINVLDYFLSFLKVYDKRKSHNMIFLMLDPRYKNLRIMYHHLLEGSKVLFLLKNMIGNPYILCCSNVMNICIFWWGQKRILLTMIYFLSRLEFGYVWVDYKHKWISKRTC